ncbi:MAG: hypothetical protein ACHQZS_02715 [Candidatus Binatales bacterium]
MQASARLERFSGLLGQPAGPANHYADHYYIDRLVMNAFLSELPGIAFAVVTVFYLATTFAALVL